MLRITKFLFLVACISMSSYAFWLFYEAKTYKIFSDKKQKKNFALYQEPIDVVIPCVDKDLLTLELCIEGIRNNGANIRRIIVVSPKKYTASAEWFDEKQFPFNKTDIALALFSSKKKADSYLSSENNRTGWLFQQLIKLYAMQVIPNLSSNVLLLDADTIFLSPITFINEKRGAIFHPALDEGYLPYLKHAKHLLPGFHSPHPEYSGVSHHMLIQKSILESLFNEVESRHKKPFWQVFCSFVNKKDIYLLGASEYEIYFNYALAKTDQVSIQELKWDNIADLYNLDKYKEQEYHYISAHDYLR